MVSAATPLLLPVHVFVDRLRRHARLGESDLTAIAGLLGDTRSVAADRWLVRQGDSPPVVHVLIEGWAARVRLLADGRRILPALLLPGDVCDLPTAYLRQADHGLMTLTPATLACVDRRALRDLAARRPPVAEALTWLLASDQARTSELVTSIGRRSALEHLAHLLCELHARLLDVGGVEGNGYALPLTHEELADTLGLTAVHISRMLQRLRGDGLISLAAHKLVILDRPGLARLATFHPAYLHLRGTPRPVGI